MSPSESETKSEMQQENFLVTLQCILTYIYHGVLNDDVYRARSTVHESLAPAIRESSSRVKQIKTHEHNQEEEE